MLAWLDAAPQGTTLAPAALRDVLTPLLGAEGQTPSPAPAAASGETWRERLWTAPPETRLGVREAAEAIGRPPSFVYRATGGKGTAARIPHRKLAGELVFLAGELRTWLQDEEETIAPGRVERPALTLTRGAS